MKRLWRRRYPCANRFPLGSISGVSRLCFPVFGALALSLALQSNLLVLAAQAATNNVSLEKTNPPIGAVPSTDGQSAQHLRSTNSPSGQLEKLSFSAVDWAPVLFAVATVVSFTLLVASLQSGGRVAIENHWGGLGGSLGGIRISTPFIYLLLTCVFVLLWYGTIQQGRVGAGVPKTGSVAPAVPPVKT